MSTCKECGASFEQVRRQGRPFSLCRACRLDPELVKEKRRAYFQRPEVKEKRRAYRQRPEVKEKRRAYRQRPEVKAKQAAYYQRPEVKAKKAAYYQTNRAEIAQNKLPPPPPSKWNCVDCGEPLRRNTEDGLCGFCRQGIPA